jgi:hypothetical protein
MAGLLLPVIPTCVTSAAVTVALLAVLRVHTQILRAAHQRALAGMTALGFARESATVSLVLTTFQFTSTALTVTLKGVPAVWAEACPSCR